MPSNADFSIITPVLNGMPWLPDALRSIERQRRDVSVEHIILDAGSTDGSRECIMANAPDARHVFEPDGGQTQALIKGLARAQAPWLGWLNADDVLEDGALLRVAQAFRAHPTASVVSGGCLLVRADGSIQGALPTLQRGRHQDLLATVVNLAQPATFFTRAGYDAVGGLDPRFSLAMDVDLWFRLSRTQEVRLLPDQVLARFRVHPAARSVRAARQTAREDLDIRLREGLSPLSGVARMLAMRSALPAGLNTALNAAYEAIRGTRHETDGER